MDQLSKGERIVAISSALLAVFSLFPLWASYSFTGLGQDESEGASVWSEEVFSFLPKLAIFLALVCLALVIFKAAGQSFNLDHGSIFMALGGLAFILLLLTVFQGPKGVEELAGFSDVQLEGFEDIPGFDFNFEVSRGILLYGAPLLAAGIAFGGYLLKKGGAVTTNRDTIVTPPPPEV